MAEWQNNRNSMNGLFMPFKSARLFVVGRGRRRDILMCWCLTAVMLCLGAGGAQAAWPQRVFAPYMYIGADDQFKLSDCDDACKQKYYTVAFIIADERKNPAWDGRFDMKQNLYADQIRKIRRRGGDVIVSFGGGAGTELALAETNSATLLAKYRAVIDRYRFTWLDFDIEGDALAKTEANERRNAVLARLQAKQPKLRISYTLPVDPNGIPAKSRALLADARAKGVKVYSVNVMTMDFGVDFTRNRTMSDVSVASVLKAREQCAAIDPAILIGVTPMIGRNDERSEIFSLDDARSLVQWARCQPWICSLSFWASNRDTGKIGLGTNPNTSSGLEHKPFAYTRAFQEFTSERRNSGD
jgi:hypothetical protein